MKTGTIISSAVLFLAAILASYWVGYQHGTRQAKHALPQTTPSPSTTMTWEEQTVQITNDLRQQMSQWAKEGVLVMSISGPVTQKDGTISRTARLKRAKQ